jgi:hypothetical protein
VGIQAGTAAALLLLLTGITVLHLALKALPQQLKHFYLSCHSWLHAVL